MRSSFGIALFHPLNLAMIGAAVLAGLISAWWLFPVGLAFWLIMVVMVARDPALKINLGRDKRGGLARRFQRYFDRIERSHVSAFNSLSSAPAGTRRAVQPVLEAMSVLVEQAYALCQQMTNLDNYRLVTEAQGDVRADLQRINDALSQVQDPVVCQEYEASRRALQDRINRLQAVTAQLDRVEAQLLSLSNDLDGVVAEMLRLQALSAQGRGGAAEALVQKLRQQSAELAAFERQVA